MIRYVVSCDGSGTTMDLPGGYGFVVETHAGDPIHESWGARKVGSNNVMEYTAVRNALVWLRKNPSREAVIYSDSQVVVQQINGVFSVRAPELKKLYAECMLLLLEVVTASVVWRPRNSTAGLKRADFLAGKARKAAMKKRFAIGGK